MSNLDSYKNELEEVHKYPKAIIYPSDEINYLLSSWFTKIYYGLKWFDKDDLEDDVNFQLMRKSYKMSKGFNLPSSLYCFRFNAQIPFDFRRVDNIFSIKIREHFFMISIGDGQLSYDYMNDTFVEEMKFQFYRFRSDPRFFLVPLSHLIAVRNNLPKSPSFVIGEKSIMNASIMTGSTKKL